MRLPLLTMCLVLALPPVAWAEEAADKPAEPTASATLHSLTPSGSVPRMPSAVGLETASHCSVTPATRPAIRLGFVNTPRRHTGTLQERLPTACAHSNTTSVVKAMVCA